MRRKILILLFSCLFSLSVFSEGLATSARIAGMGGVSIAVDDSESDPFVNPAKAVRISKPLVLGNFSHQSHSSERTYEKTYGGDYTDYHKTKEVYSPSTFGAMAAFFYPLGSNIALGGYYDFSRHSYCHEYDYYHTSSSSWDKSHNTWEEKTPENVIWLLGGVKLTDKITIGLSTDFLLESTEKGTGKDESAYWYSGMSDTSHHLREWEYKTTFSRKEFTCGVLIDLSEKMEIGGAFSLRRYDEDHRKTKDVRDTTVIDPDSLSQHRDLAKEDSYSLSFAPKYRFNELVRVGSIISYSWSKRTNSDKDFGVKTDTGKENFSSLDIGFGLSLTPDEETLIAFDLILTPEKSAWDYLYTETETTSTGEIHQKGDVYRTEESKYFNKTVRVGMERKISDNFSIRIGSNFLMGKCDFEVEDKEDESNTQKKYPLSRPSAFTAGFGYIWRDRLKLDYGVKAANTDYVWWWNTMDFHHQLNITYSL